MLRYGSNIPAAAIFNSPPNRLRGIASLVRTAMSFTFDVCGDYVQAFVGLLHSPYHEPLLYL